MHPTTLLALATPLLSACALFGIPGEGDDMGAVRTPELVERVGGDRSAMVEIVNGQYRFGQSLIEAPLPEGYPEPTPPGAIDVKRYPGVRRAEISGAGTRADQSMNRNFWPLFNHIKSRDIAMTSPVEMDYEGMPLSGEGAPERYTMSFLYRTADLGPTGEAGSVIVVDVEPMTVLAVGLNGGYGMRRVREGMALLESWLAEHPEWRIAGSPRAFWYNGPYVWNSRKWSEIQVPVERVAPPEATGPTGKTPATTDASERPAAG
jgi:hypothetical protein